VRDTSIFDVSDGLLKIPEGPGLGVEIDEAQVREVSRSAPRWRNPVWRHPDGSVAEW
jgi:galactonate dehydratase